MRSSILILLALVSGCVSTSTSTSDADLKQPSSTTTQAPLVTPVRTEEVMERDGDGNLKPVAINYYELDSKQDLQVVVVTKDYQRTGCLIGTELSIYSADGTESNLEADVTDRGGYEIGCGPFQPELIPEVRSNLAKIQAAPKSFSIKIWKQGFNGDTHRVEVRRLPSVCPATKLSRIDPKNIQRDATGEPKQMSYQSAISECKSKGMRLPTPREFLAFRATLGGAVGEREDSYEDTFTNVAGAYCIDTSVPGAPGTVSWNEHQFPTGSVWLGADVETYAGDPDMGRALFSTEHDSLFTLNWVGETPNMTLCVTP